MNGKAVEPGIGITYQMTIDGEQALAFEIAGAASMSRAELDDVLDRVGGAAKRRQAIAELPICKINLLTNLQMLENQRVARAEAVAASQARIAQRSTGRRNPVEIAPGDLNAISEFDKRIMQLEGSIKTGRMRIPYLEAVIAGVEPPDLFPDLADMTEMGDRMAAE